MSEKNNLSNNNEDNKNENKIEQEKQQENSKIMESKEENQELNENSNSNSDLNDDEIINIELYNEILSTLFNSLNNPIVRNEIKSNKNILKYLELQISNLLFLETVLSKELTTKKLAKEFLQLTANITNLSLSITKSPKKSRIEILEDRNLLIVTIVNSCKGVERESLEKVRFIDKNSLASLNNQIAALSDFTSEEPLITSSEESNFNQEKNLENLNQQNQINNLNNSNIKDFNNNMANLTRLGLLPQHPASNPNFYPYLTKPLVIPKLRKILSGMLIFSSLFIIITMIITLFVKGQLLFDTIKGPTNFTLSQTNNWLILIMTIILYFSFAYIFIKPTKILREKYHTSYFMLGLLFFWLVVTISYFFWEISDSYYENFFLQIVKKENLPEGGVSTIVAAMKKLPNFEVFKIFAIITAVILILPLILVLILILINPRLDRNKVIRANSEYQNAINAALNGQKYDIDPSLFDNDESSKKKRKKVNFSGHF